MTTLWDLTNSIKVGSLEFCSFPCASSQHLCSQIHFELLSFWCKIDTFGYLVRFDSTLLDQFTLFEEIDDFLLMSVKILLILKLLKLNLIKVFYHFCNSLHILFLVTAKLDPFV